MKGKRVVIDTSVWIDYFKGENKSVTVQMDDILIQADVFVPKVIIAELIQGAKSEKEISVIEGFLDAFFIIDQSKDSWAKAARLSFAMKRKGATV
ncbi:MAG: PIN domain-containing protein [Nitrospinae bacterium]|nr:PIN domain-containing protein [Nitrospinota bacterium]